MTSIHPHFPFSYSLVQSYRADSGCLCSLRKQRSVLIFCHCVVSYTEHTLSSQVLHPRRLYVFTVLSVNTHPRPLDFAELRIKCVCVPTSSALCSCHGQTQGWGGGEVNSYHRAYVHAHKDPGCCHGGDSKHSTEQQTAEMCNSCSLTLREKTACLYLRNRQARLAEAVTS